MFSHSTNATSFFSVFIAALIFSLALAGVAAAQPCPSSCPPGNNTSLGTGALQNNKSIFNTAIGADALRFNTTGSGNTAIGSSALAINTTGSRNTANGFGADVSFGNLINATAIGAKTVVNASNKIRLGNSLVTVIEGQVAFTSSSDKTKKENFQPVDGEAGAG